MAEHHHQHAVDHVKMEALIKEAFPDATQEKVDQCCHLCCCCIDACCAPEGVKTGPVIDRLTDAIKKILERKDDILEMIDLIMLFIKLFSDKASVTK